MDDNENDNSIFEHAEKVLKMLEKEIRQNEREILLYRSTFRQIRALKRSAIRVVRNPFGLNIWLLFLSATINSYLMILRHGPQMLIEISMRNRIKKPPGTFLNTIAEFLYTKNTYQHVFQPTISDMRDEYYEAVEKGCSLKAKWINVRYWFVFILTMTVHGLTSLLKIVEKIKKIAD